MRKCLSCEKDFDDNELKWDFGDILMEKYGYSGEILMEAIERCDYDFCAECNADMFDPDEFEDDVVPVAQDSETGEYRSWHEGTVDGCDDALWCQGDEE